MVGREQNKLQVLASSRSLGDLLSLKQVLHERSLVSRKPLAAAEKVEERVAVADKERAERVCGLHHGSAGRMGSVGLARTMVEEHDRKGARTVGRPQESLEP